MVQKDKYIFRETIENPHDVRRSPWHVNVTSLFPDRVVVTDPNDQIIGRGDLDTVLDTAEVTLLCKEPPKLTLPAILVDRIVEVIEVASPPDNT